MGARTKVFRGEVPRELRVHSAQYAGRAVEAIEDPVGTEGHDRVGDSALLARYSAVGLFGLTLNMALLVLLVSAVKLDQVIAEALALPTVVLTTFLVNRYWVFGAHVSGAGASSPRARRRSPNMTG